MEDWKEVIQNTGKRYVLWKLSERRDDFIVFDTLAESALLIEDEIEADRLVDEMLRAGTMVVKKF